MKTIETVYNKLNQAKTELATHKIELAAKDAIQFKKEAEQIYFNAKKESEAEILNASSKMNESFKI